MAESIAFLTANDKTHLPELATALAEANFNIISYGGTGQIIKDLGIDVISPRRFLAKFSLEDVLSDYTDRSQREILGALIAPSMEYSDEDLVEYGVPRIDMVYVHPMEGYVRQKRDGKYNGIRTDKGGEYMIKAAMDGQRLLLTYPGQIPGFIETVLKPESLDRFGQEDEEHMAEIQAFEALDHAKTEIPGLKNEMLLLSRLALSPDPDKPRF
jgi:AICAR transformylase/IMP cyclohydrolase PurH